MNLWTQFKSWLSPQKEAIKSYALSKVAYISQLDGKPGMSAADIQEGIKKVLAVNTVLSGKPGKERAQFVANWLDDRFGDSIPDGWSDVIVAYLYDAATVAKSK